jgi:5-methylcytosine-specific restriction endonuclease McrA
VPARAGYASLREYADRVVGLSGRETEERLRVGRALAELVELDRALGSGELCWSAVREVTRVATRETEHAWLGWAKGRRVRQIEEAVAARRRGDRPDDRPDPSLVKHRLSFEVRAETMALFRDLQTAVRRDLGGDVDDDALLFEIARRALGGPDDEGRASYQVAVTQCDECGRTSIDGGGLSHPVDDVVAEMVSCDSQRVHGCKPAPGAADASPHVGAATSRPRATQTIPPAIRRQVMRRDHQRCVVPGCTNHRFLDVHHLDLRSEGGSHDPERMAIACGPHHRAAHAGTLCIDGTAKSGFTFRHADGTAYGAPLSPAAIDVATQVLSALENLGFKHKRARELVDTVLRAGAPDDPADFLRAALRAS